MSEDTLLAAVSRAAKANELLENELLQEAFAEAEASYIRELIESGLDSEKRREKLYLSIKALRDVRSHLHSLISNGLVAKHEIEHINEVRRMADKG